MFSDVQGMVIGDRLRGITSPGNENQDDEDSSSLSSRATSPGRLRHTPVLYSTDTPVSIGGTVNELRAKLRLLRGPETLNDVQAAVSPEPACTHPREPAEPTEVDEEEEIDQLEEELTSSQIPLPSAETAPSIPSSTPSLNLEEPTDAELERHDMGAGSRSTSCTLSHSEPTPPYDGDETLRPEDEPALQPSSISQDSTPEPDFVKPKHEDLDSDIRLPTPADFYGDDFDYERDPENVSQDGSGSGELDSEAHENQTPLATTPSACTPLGSPSDGQDLPDILHAGDPDAPLEDPYELLRERVFFRITVFLCS